MAASPAAVEFVGSNWNFGNSQEVVISSVGITTYPDGIERVTLNFTDKRQVKLSEGLISLGLSLVPLKGSCIKVIPGYRFESVNIITSCQ